MRFEDWKPIYDEIIVDMGYSITEDESSARLLKAMMINANLISDGELSERIGSKASIFGAAECLEREIKSKAPEGTLISAGSATERIMKLGINPDIIVTDLDGDIDSQIDASRHGAVTVIHAHGDNTDLIMKYCKEFKGDVVLTTQSVPDGIIRNFGGFTDGDRAVCLASHFGATSELYGFDFERAYGSDTEIKKKKLLWAKRIIETVRKRPRL